MKYLIIAALFLTGCTDTDRASFDALGKSGTIDCYSGGIKIFSGSSTGKILTVKNSDGWQFKDKETNLFIRVSGDCVIKN